MTGEAPRASEWVGERFPLDYELASLDGADGVSLEATLESLPRGGVLLVCLMTTYRANGPYSDFLRHYRVLASRLGPLVQLHVITCVAEREENWVAWGASEDDVRADGLPLRIAHDPHDQLARAVRQRSAPQVFILDRHGVVLAVRAGDDRDVLAALAGAARG